MSESIFASIIEEYADREWSSYAAAPEFKTSKKHDRAMNRIFRRYERNTRHLVSDNSRSGFRVTPKRLLILIAIVLLLITGCSIVYFSTMNIKVELHKDGMTEFSVINTKNSPALIETKYYLPELPEGFEELYTGVKRSTKLYDYYKYSSICDHYEDSQTRHVINFRQTAKSEFEPLFFDLNNSELAVVDINGYSGILFDLNFQRNCVIWDNGDYIFELVGDIPKNGLLDLAKSAKLPEI